MYDKIEKAFCVEDNKYRTNEGKNEEPAAKERKRKSASKFYINQNIYWQWKTLNSFNALTTASAAFLSVVPEV